MTPVRISPFNDTTIAITNGDSRQTMFNVQEEANRLYRGKALAPMVRASTTPLRTLALEYGADLVYTEELIDRSIRETVRQENSVLGTIDYVKDTSQLSKKTQKKLSREQRPCLILRIDPSVETSRLICQLGTGEPDLALEAALHVHQDFSAIDINMGCPKKFSVSGGMGSALLKDPVRAAKLISTLRHHIPKPISCKIRLLSTAQETVDFVEQMIAAGVNAVAIHARKVGQEATVPADWKTLEKVVHQLRSQHPTFPFLLNGDFYDRDELQELQLKTNASGVLLGRPALYNTSLFRPLEQSLEDKTKVIQRYLQLAARYDIHFKNPKYVVCEMMNNRRAPTPRVPHLPQDFSSGGQTIAKTCNCSSLQQLFQVWNLEWKGMGRAALGMVEESNATTTTTNADAALAPGEHRYEDSYFLGTHKRAAIQDQETDKNPVHKRPKVEIMDNDTKHEEKKE